MYEQPVLGKHGVERGHGVFRRLGNLAVIFPYQFGSLVGGVLQAHHLHALRQAHLRQRLLVEAVVDDEIERRGKVGHVATEDAIWIHWELHAVDVHPIVGGEQFLHAGILVSLYLARGEALTLEILEGGVAHGVHHSRGVGVEHVACLGVKLYVLFFTTHDLLLTFRISRRPLPLSSRSRASLSPSTAPGLRS